MQIIILVALEIFLLILLRIFCESILSKRVNNKTLEILTWCGYFVVFNGATYFIQRGLWFNIIVFVLSFFGTLKILYKDSVRTLLGVTIFLYLSGMCSELIVYFGKELLPNILKTDAEVLYMVWSRLVWFIILKATASIIKLTKKIELNFQDWLEVFIVPISSIFILLVIFAKSSNMQDSLSFWAVVMVLAINIFTYYLYDKAKENMGRKMREGMLARQCEYYVCQYNASQEWWQELRRFKHDMKQHYLLEKAYMEAGDYDAMLKYCNENLDFVNRSSVVSNTGNLYFDSIINYKADEARLCGIEFAADINILADIKVQPEDLSICLGNLLDNAIEATKELTEEKRIDLQICVDGNNLFIDVRNKYQNHRQKENGRYLTSKKNDKQHGYGLEIVKQIVSKYEGDLHIKDKNQKFEVEVVLYNFIL